MAEDICRGILEFLHHKPILDSLADVIPVSDNNFVLSKLLLLQKLQHEVSNCLVSEKVLDFLAKIYEVDKCLGSKDCPESLKNAYCCVAVEWTIGCLRKCDYDVKGEYFDVVKSFWRGRVREMEREKVGLVSKELLEWRDDIEAAVWEESVCLKVVERSKDVDAAEAVKLYLDEEKSRIGTLFLELVSETLKPKEGAVTGAVCLKKRGESGECQRSDAQEQQFDNNDSSCDKGKNVMLVDMEKRSSLGRCKHGAHERSKKGASGSSSGVKMAAVEDDFGAGQLCNDHLLGILEVEKEQEALANKDLEPHGDQNIELPERQTRGKSSEDDAKSAQFGEANVCVENMDSEPLGDDNRAKSPETVEPFHSSGRPNRPSSRRRRISQNMDSEPPGDDNRAKSPDTVEPFDSSGRPNRPSSRRRQVSPLNIYKEPKVKKPRTRKTWSNVEEDTLRSGVVEFGHGHWKLILNKYRDIFQGRTEIDLKDKWRNMIR